MNKVLQNGENFHFKVTKNKSITAAKLIGLMKESFELTLSYLKKKTDLTKQKEAFVKRNNASYALFGFPWAFLVWIYETFPHLGRYADKSLDSPLSISHFLRWHTSKWDNIIEGDPFKYKENHTKIVHSYLTPTVREMEQRYIRIFKPYTDEVRDTSINALKAQLKGVTVLTSSAEVVDEDEDLGGHHYVPSTPRACDHAGSSGLKTSPDPSNVDDLCGHVALLDKNLLDIASFVRDERLRRIEKNKKKQQEEDKLIYFLLFQFNFLAYVLRRREEEEETEEKNTADEEDAKEQEQEEEEEEEEEEERGKDEEMKAEAEEENEKKTKEDGEKKLEEEEDKNEKVVEDELVVEQEVEKIEEEKKSSKKEEKKNEKKEVEEEEKKHEEKEVDVMGIVAELN
ncbi:hypothetical protein FXO37_22343 [Capsicum annuum]|nr:hypothetical protein FXO37_22343 [Capsicum annuum]